MNETVANKIREIMKTDPVGTYPHVLHLRETPFDFLPCLNPVNLWLHVKHG